eukprot:TRINITY_DN1739_c3_g1_i1.p1 TRINITY_DN1739_c3_g1~~TRINITY_DN1739_c3_g1_i1.p1  ORF type:complete len:1010 (-),score=412.95 TRINITY_DN1739_c3_g1_i1:307-3279(-)
MMGYANAAAYAAAAQQQQQQQQAYMQQQQAAAAQQQQAAAQQQQQAAWAQQQQQLQAQQRAQQQAAAAQQQQAAAQQQQQQVAQQRAAQQGQQQAPQGQSATIGAATAFTVSGCQHPTVGATVRGNYNLAAENHGRRAYKRDQQVNGLDVMLYFWDERDGPNFCGWWFGPKIGGDQVWAYHPDKAAQVPPTSGWKVPYDGPVDASFQLTPGAAGGAPAQGQQNPQWAAQQQQQQQQQMMQQQRQQQMMQQQQQQRQQMEAQRRQLEEANRRRQQQQQQEMMERKKAEMERQQKELEKRRLEQAAATSIRKVIQALRSGLTPENVEQKKSDLAEALSKELEATGSMQELIKKECDLAIANADQTIKTIEENKKRMEEQRALEEQKRQEQAALCAQRTQELAALISSAEELVADFKTKAAPLLELTEMDAQEVETTAAAAEEAGKEAKQKVKECTEFLTQKSAELREPARKPGETVPAEDPEKPTLRTLAPKLAALSSGMELDLKKCAEGKQKVIRKAAAKKRLTQDRATVAKYDKDGDGVLSRKELQAYAKGEFKYTLPAMDIDGICQALVAEGEKGIPVDAFHKLKSAVGICHEKVRDSKLREVRLAREKEVADAREVIQGVITKATEALVAAGESVKTLEETSNPLVKRAQTDTAKEMNATADEVDSLVEKAKASVAKVRETTTGITSELPELVGFATGESNKLGASCTKLDERINKASSAAAKHREEAAKKETRELEDLRKKAVKMVREHQAQCEINTEKVYEAFDANKDGKVDEQEFSAFFKTCKKAEANGEAKEAADGSFSAEDLARLYSYLDVAEEGVISKEHFWSFIRCYMKVVKETVVTSEVGIKGGKTLRRVEAGEVCEVVDGPVKEEEVGIRRLKVRMLKDDTEGWVTPVGNQGTAFLDEGVIEMKVLKETILTPTFEIGASKETTKKLKAGELVEVVEWMRKEESSGLMRMKVRTKADLKVGWATAVGNAAGAVFLEVAV